MKVTYITQHFATPEAPGSSRHWLTTHALKDAGWDVRVITGQGYLPANLKHGDKTRRFEIDGIEVLVLGVDYSQKMGVLKRGISFLRFMAGACTAVLRGPCPDVILATSTPLTVAVPALLANRIRRVPFVFEVRDRWPDGPVELGKIRNRLLIRALYALEHAAYRRAEAVIALSPGMRDGILRTRVVPEAKVSVITNFADTGSFSPSIDGDTFRRRHGLTGRFVCGHTGTMGFVNGVDAILDAAAILRDRAPEVVFLLVGDGSERRALEARARSDDLRNVCFVDPVPKNEMSSVLGALNVGLMTIRYYKIKEENCANKFFDYLSVGLPVLLNYGGWQAECVAEYGAGRDVPPNDAGALADAVLTMFRNADACARMGRAARKLAEDRFAAELQLGWLTDVVSRAARGHDPQDNFGSAGGAGVTSVSYGAPAYDALKRSADMITAALALAVAAPVVLAVAALVAWRLGRPILYRAERAGRHGKPFTLLKFRSMTDERDAAGELLPDEARLIAFGRFLRRASLDELPQLINVLRGNMSLVGPRPLPVRYNRDYDARQATRLAVRPGLTGLSQVNYRAGQRGWDEKLEWDARFVERANPLLDIWIVLRTLLVLPRRLFGNRTGQTTSEPFNRNS